MLTFLPARTEAKCQTSVGEIVHGRRHAGGQHRVAKRKRRNQRAKRDAAGIAGQPGQRDPQFKRVFIGRIHVGKVVGTIQTDKSQLLHKVDNFLPAGPGQSVLAFEHDRNFQHSDSFFLKSTAKLSAGRHNNLVRHHRKSLLLFSRSALTPFNGSAHRILQ